MNLFTNGIFYLFFLADIVGMETGKNKRQEEKDYKVKNYKKKIGASLNSLRRVGQQVEIGKQFQCEREKGWHTQW